MRKLIALALLPLTLSNCALFLIGAAGETGISTVEERSYGRKVEDHTIYVNITDQFIKSGHDGLAIDATVNVRHGRVMLTGNLASQEAVQKAVTAARKVKGVKELINELSVNPDAGLGNDTNDLFIKKNLVARMIITKDVWYINYSIDVVNGTAYLLGFTKDQGEMDRALNVARTTKGVKKVVNHLQVSTDASDFTDSNPDATISAAPAASVVNVPASSSSIAPLPPTEGTISTEPVSSGDLSAPLAPAAPATPAPTAKPTWK